MNSSSSLDAQILLRKLHEENRNEQEGEKVATDEHRRTRITKLRS